MFIKNLSKQGIGVFFNSTRILRSHSRQPFRTPCMKLSEIFQDDRHYCHICRNPLHILPHDLSHRLRRQPHIAPHHLLNRASTSSEMSIESSRCSESSISTNGAILPKCYISADGLVLGIHSKIEYSSKCLKRRSAKGRFRLGPQTCRRSFTGRTIDGFFFFLHD
jgi:hypothetical protein